MAQDTFSDHSDSGIWKNRFLLGALTAGHMVNDWVGGTIWILAPAIAASLGLGPAEVGWILAINGLAAGLVYIPAGIISDRVSNQGFLMLITFWWVAVGYFVATIVPGFWPITLLLAFGVMGDAFWHPVATGSLVKAMPGRRAQVLGIHAMGGSLGGEILGPVSAGLLLGYFSWQTSLQLLVIPAVIMGLLFIPISRRLPRSTGKGLSKQDLQRLFRSWGTPVGIGMVLMMVFYNMSLFAIMSMTPLTLQQVYDFTPFMGSVVFAAMLVFGTLCQPFIGHFSDRTGRKKLILVMIGCAAVSAVFAGLTEELWVFLCALVGSAALLTAVRPIILAAAVDFSGKSESTTLGIVFAILDGVGALGALLAGYAGELELGMAFILAGILAMLSVFAALLVRFPNHRQATV